MFAASIKKYRFFLSSSEAKTKPDKETLSHYFGWRDLMTSQRAHVSSKCFSASFKQSGGELRELSFSELFSFFGGSKFLTACDHEEKRTQAQWRAVSHWQRQCVRARVLTHWTRFTAGAQRWATTATHHAAIIRTLQQKTAGFGLQNITMWRSWSQIKPRTS